jgi:hypothetical protein
VAFGAEMDVSEIAGVVAALVGAVAEDVEDGVVAEGVADGVADGAASEGACAIWLTIAAICASLRPFPLP